MGGSDCDARQQMLRSLLDAVGEAQAASGRPDLMYPLQYGGLPLSAASAAAPGGALKPAAGPAVALQLPHLPVSAAAAVLLAAVPSLEAVQQMAAMRQSANGGMPSLFQ